MTLLKTYMPEDHAYIQRSAFIYSNYLSGLYNLPATPKISTKTSLRPIWSGQSVYNSSLRSLGSEEQEEELATSFSLRLTLSLAHLHCSADQLLWQVQEEKREEHRDGVRAMWSVWGVTLYSRWSGLNKSVVIYSVKYKRFHKRNYWWTMKSTLVL